MLSKKTQKPSTKPKTREFRRAELLLLEAQKTLIEQRIHQLEQVGEVNLIGRKPKRDLTGLALPDRSKGNKRTKHETPVSLEDMFNECRKLLNQLKRNKNAVPFLSPVDPVALNCPDYFAIIKHPMDFKTIGNKLRATKRQYRTPLDFRDDMRLVFKNCTLYNPEGNQIRIMGDHLSDAFESLWHNSEIERHFQERREIQSRDRHGLETRHLGDDVEGGPRGQVKRKKRRSLEYSLQRLSEVHTRLMELTSTALNNNESGEAMDIDKPMGFWQRRQLSQDLENAPIEKLRTLQPVLEELEEGELVFDELTDAMLWRFKSFMNTNQSLLESNVNTMIPRMTSDQPSDKEKQESQQPNVQSLIMKTESVEEGVKDLSHVSEEGAKVLSQVSEEGVKDLSQVSEEGVKDLSQVSEGQEEREKETKNEAGSFGTCGQDLTKNASPPPPPQSNGGGGTEEPNSETPL